MLTGVKKLKMILWMVLLTSICISGTGCSTSMHGENEIDVYEKINNMDRSEYPDDLIKLYERNPETEEFVLNYPNNKNIEKVIDLSNYKHSKTVPQFMQWDTRWGYAEYSGNMIGLSGCGPTCLSMVTIYITGNVEMHPKALAEFATKQGYVVDGTGTKWTLFSEGARKLGLDVTELPLDESRIIRNLEVGNPIICAMGPGDFTTTGHFIVLTGYVDGKIKINDPNSYMNSERLWKYDEIVNQIKNLWAFR